MRIYIASGWFDEKQEIRRQEILKICKELKLNVYSPKEDMLYEPGKIDPRTVFIENLTQIRKSSAVLASTEGKDLGSVWECGYAYANNIPIIYYFPYSTKFNLMLAQSAVAVITSTNLLRVYLERIQADRKVYSIFYSGDIE